VDWETAAKTLAAEHGLSIVSPIPAGNLWRLLWRSGRNHDDGGVERDWAYRYQADECIKVVLVAAANTIAILCFAFAGSIAWRQTLVMLLAAAVGGYLGARIALRLSRSQIRIGISVINFLITAVFFYTRFF